MNPTLLSRLHAAAALIFKSGAPFPFNKIMPYDAMGGEKMYRAYEQSAWVMRAIKKIAGPISAVGLEFTRNGQPFQEEELEAFWEMPAAGLTRSDFIEATVGWLKLEGEAFWILDDSWLAASGGRQAVGGFSPLIVARPDRMRHIVKGGVLTGWEYVDGAGRQALLLPEQVVQTKMWNPYNEWRGLAELKPCRDAAEADFLAGKFNLNLMRNNGDQGVYVIAKNGVPTDGQRQQIVDQIREKRELAQRGVFKPVFLGGDVVIEDPKIRVPDKAFNATRLQNRHEIFIAMGVPASMADVQASYSIGSASDWFLLISETCIPTGEKICAAISQVARRQTGLDARARLNWDEHPVVQSVRRERADTAQKYFQMGVPLKALNDYLDLELPACPDWEKGYVPINLAVIGGTVLAGNGGTPTEPMDDTVALMRNTVDAAGAHIDAATNTGTPLPSPLPTSWGEGIKRSSDAAVSGCAQAIARLKFAFDTNPPERNEVGQRRELIGPKREMAKAFESRFNRELMKARAETLRNLMRPGTETVFDLEGFANGLVAALRPVAEIGFQRAGEIPMTKERLEAGLSGREASWRGVAEKIHGKITGVIRDAEDGKGGDAVRGAFNEISKELAGTAVEEMEAVFELGRTEAGASHHSPYAAPDGAEEVVGNGLSTNMSRLTALSDRSSCAAGQCLLNPLEEGSPSLRLSPRKRGEREGLADSSVVIAQGGGPGAEGRLVRLIHPVARIVDASRGIVDYIASDESIDSYREVIRASGWRFNHFAKNAPFVDSHDYSTIEKCLGRVLDFRVEGGQLIERVQWAIDVPENKLAQIGWKMTQAGYLKAVSVGFFPVKYVTPSSGEAWSAQLKELGLPADAPVRTIYTEQEQVELSCCVVGANANALAKAYQAGAIDAADVETLSLEYAQRENAGVADSPAHAAPALEQARRRFLEELQGLIPHPV